jgi:hypothetical protein
MRGPPAAAHARGGMHGTESVITLELRLDGQSRSPVGRASTPDNQERRFAGWLALIAAIDALATDDPNRQHPTNQEPSGHSS